MGRIHVGGWESEIQGATRLEHRAEQNEHRLILRAMTGSNDHAWTRTPLRDRLAWLASFRGRLAGAIDPLCALIEREVGKPAWEAMTADVLSLLSACRWHEREAARVLRQRRIGGGLMHAGTRVVERREPLGRVAIIATWNYPVQLLGIQLVQALVAGNTVVVKPSEHAPRTQEALLRLARDAGLPDGALEWVAATREAGARLLADQTFDHVVFTGSTRVGRAIASVAADRLIPTTLELSGRDSAIVLDDADVKLAAKSIWAAVTMNGGQTCMAPRRVLVSAGAYDAFIDAMAPLAGVAKPRRLINEEAARRVVEQCRDAVAAGGRSITGVLEPARSATVTPTLIVDCPRGAALVQGEHFGPAAAVVRCADVRDAISVHRACGQHLATSVFSRDVRATQAMANELGSSLITINDAVIPAGHPGACLGGRGESGWGVSRGREGLLAMTRPVCVTVTSSWLRPPLDAPTGARAKMMSRWLTKLFGGRATAALPEPQAAHANLETKTNSGALAGAPNQ